MLELTFTTEEIARTRFAISPLWETVAARMQLSRPSPSPVHRRWAAQVAPRVSGRDPEWPLLAELVPPGARRMPALVCPVPARSMPDLERELEGLRAQTPEFVRTSLDMVPTAQGPEVDRLRDDPVDCLRRLSDELTAYWETAVAPYWPQVLTLLESEVLHRARRLAEGGVGHAFGDLDPGIRWKDVTLHVPSRTADGRRDLDGRGLVLTPTAFEYPGVWHILSPLAPPTVRYPARGLGTLWEGRSAPVPEALTGVLGRTRARLLAELETPAGQGDLVRRTGRSKASVSEGLTALRRAGLVSRHRTGRHVLYTRTGLGEHLVESSGTSDGR
ncbi:winged helix-turn-helix transcriptional regulator [Nocardiopsis sp. HNM0947]|uniref:Winged helix-turn-helix transcriptional regulator n=1 Tax=Nocardiopsis coralli TaxID=2772213 RepID=A0ABR9P8U7_9ACTN|nr:winged helix-turn-helix domain-containing protein [Nocardiopsis coralli]MBE3000265.1 winged helix-turn-helix transcriptional regulator [Nocardiopsis coralli]